MSAEAEFIARLRAIATYPAARGLADDAAVLRVGGETLVLTHDTLVEGVHFLPDDPPGDVAWKLLAVNLSDLAAKGATPIGALMGYCLTGDAGWDAAFATGLSEALTAFDTPLLGGDTVRGRERQLSMTLIGRAGGAVPSRSGAHDGDAVYVTGTIGDAGAGLEVAKGRGRDAQLLAAYRRPQPELMLGRALAPKATAMMDISDGLLIDAARLAKASGVAIAIDLDAVPLSPAFCGLRGSDRAARIAAATAGDDYRLLFTMAQLPPCPATRIGQVTLGHGLHLHDRDGDVPLPATLGWEH